MRRGPTLPGAGWLMLAAAVAPLLLQAAKPLARRLGKGMQKFGEKLAAEAAPQNATTPPEPDTPASAQAASAEQAQPNPKTARHRTVRKTPPKAKPRKPIARKPRTSRRPTSEGASGFDAIDTA